MKIVEDKLAMITGFWIFIFKFEWICIPQV